MDKKRLIILVLALVVILGGAYILYNKLGSGIKTEQIAVEGSPANTERVSRENVGNNSSGEAEGTGQSNTVSNTAVNTGNTAADDTSQNSGKDNSEKTENTASSNTEASDYRAPDFTVLDADGNRVRLSDQFGKPIVLNFWASWCGPCQAEMPEFDAACSELEGKVVFMMVDLTDGSRETLETAKAFIREKGFAFPVYFDTLDEAASTYGVTSIPTTYFIDSNGDLTARGVGTLDRETLDKGISMILDE